LITSSSASKNANIEGFAVYWQLRAVVRAIETEGCGVCCVGRARTMQVYTLFSRKPEREVWDSLRRLHVHYAVLENAWCAGRSESVFTRDC